jgi:hypothetical protein
MTMAADENFLSRWSRRKSQARVSTPEAEAPPDAQSPPPAAAGAAPGAAPRPDEPKALPPVDSLTTESDFSPYMAPEVDADLRRKALKTLFADPRFNTMDMMDVYVDDYSKPDPLPDSWLAKMEQVSRLGDRAGRDREEAERSKALAEARADGPASETKEKSLAADAADDGGGTSGEPPAGTGGAAAADTPEAVIPPQK